MRLIDADALMEAMYHRAFETDGDTMWQSGCWVRYKAIEQVVKEQPSVEAEPVVRCKDCIHYMPYDWMFSEVRQSASIDDYPQDEIGCEWIDHHVKPDDYCIFGERKEQ